jgi:HPt (histidine-containing phosphotransfer) domain-containing protein
VDQATLLNTIRRFDSRARRNCAAVARSPENILALVPKYLGSKPRQIEEARASLETKDFESIRRFGHNLRGTGAGYGFERIGDIGTEIEKGAIDHNERAIGEQLKALSEFLAQEQARASGSVEAGGGMSRTLTIN